MRPVIHTGRIAAYRLDASSRYSASSSALAALSTWPVPSQRLAHQMVPPIAFGTVQICQFGQSASSLATISSVGFCATGDPSSQGDPEGPAGDAVAGRARLCTWTDA